MYCKDKKSYQQFGKNVFFLVFIYEERVILRGKKYIYSPLWERFFFLFFFFSLKNNALKENFKKILRNFVQNEFCHIFIFK